MENSVNLDCMTPQECAAYATVYMVKPPSSRPNAVASTMDDSTPEVAAQLALYAQSRCLAAIARSFGHIECALAVETAMDHLYKKLPESARW
jgi:hypothetical protein